jgi:hypothetical protein
MKYKSSFGHPWLMSWMLNNPEVYKLFEILVEGGEFMSLSRNTDRGIIQ